MRAEQYIEKFLNYVADPKSMWDDGVEVDPNFTAAQQICLDLVDEMLDLIKSRRVSLGAAIASVIREQDQKWGAILIRLKISKIDRMGFLDMLKEINPLAREAYDEFVMISKAA